MLSFEVSQSLVLLANKQLKLILAVCGEKHGPQKRPNSHE